MSIELDEYFDNDVIVKLINGYNKYLSKHVVNSIPRNLCDDEIDDIKRDILIMGLEFCSKLKGNFNPQKGKKPELYFSTILKSFVVRECQRFKDSPEYKRLHRERLINDLLGYPNPPKSNYLPLEYCISQFK